MLNALLLAWIVPFLPAHGAADDPLARLYLWIGRARLAPGSIDEPRQAELRAILGELRIQRTGGSDPSAIDLGLVGLAGLGAAEEGEGETEKILRASARQGRAELETLLARGDAPLALRLATSVLDPRAKRPRAERLVAAELLTGVFCPATLAALCAAAREPDRALAEAATHSLVGWSDPDVQRFFLAEIESGRWFAALTAEHFRRVRDALDDAQRERLCGDAARLYLAPDWRSAARARGLLAGLDTPRAVPILIEALAAWVRRTQEGRGSRRIRAEIVEQLERLSGRNLGPVPERWIAWWEGVRAGRTALPEDQDASAELTRATFFGLRAESDHVLFVVDSSGSMRTRFGTGELSRYEEALQQLDAFLRRSGEETRFGVAVFSEQGDAWRTRLCAASPGNLELARRWLAEHAPGGSTQLFQGLRAALGLDAHGHLALERCETDTVIVLCDGATSEGPGWVERWLAQENEDAQIVFHCVQIGGEGDGTLEALARGSGGEFLRVGG